MIIVQTLQVINNQSWFSRNCRTNPVLWEWFPDWVNGRRSCLAIFSDRKDMVSIWDSSIWILSSFGFVFSKYGGYPVLIGS